MTLAPTLNGQVIGQAERATRALLDTLLDRVGTPFESWVALNLVGTGGPTSVDDLVAKLVEGLRITPDDASGVVGDVQRDGLLTVDDAVALTSAGRDLYQRITAGIAEVTTTLYGDLPEAELVVARRVLETVTQRARKLATERTD